MEEKNMHRRDFLKASAVAGACVGLSTNVLAADKNKKQPEKNEEDKKPPLPLRKFGKHKIKVPIFTLGISFNTIEKQVILLKALRLGVTSWDTANYYAGGNSETGIGKLLKKEPELRKQLFIATQPSGDKTPDEFEKNLKTSFERMNTDYVDLFFGLNWMKSADQFNDDIRKWVEQAKKDKKIRFFGISSHSNMADCLLAVSKTDWVDAAMVTYNFRLTRDKKMQEALQAAYEAGIPVIAMKTQGKGPENDHEKELIEYFTDKGFTEGQAKLKAVIRDKRICSACVGIGKGSIEHLILNVDAVKDLQELDEKDVAFLADYANKTCDGYCPGCAHICASASPQMPYIADVMRYMMYHNSYGDTERAKQLFAQLPASAKAKLLNADFSRAQAKCPRHLPIAKIMSRAAKQLA